MFPILETERLLLREIRQEDAEDLFTCFSNPQVLQHYGMDPLRTVEQAEGLVDHFKLIWKERRGIRWGIQIKGEEGLAGTIGFNLWSPKHRRAEIGYELHPNYWGRGYAAEAVDRVTAYGFDELDLLRIGAVVFLENERSFKLLERLGFNREGILRNYIYQGQNTWDVFMYSILKEKLHAQ